MFLAYREKPGKCEIFFLGFPCFSRLFGYRILRFPRNRGILESWESIPAFSRFFKRKEKPGKRGIFIPGSPDFSGWHSMLSRKLWSPGKPGKLGIIPGFPRFFAHRGKPGKRGAFLPGFPGFPRLLRVTFLASQETVESWKAHKVRSLLVFHAFLESQETPGFPGFSLCAKKRGKPGIFPRNSRDFLALFCWGGAAKMTHLLPACVCCCHEK